MSAVSVSPVPSPIIERLDRWRVEEQTEVLSSTFLDALASIPDPRNARGCRYPLAGLLAIAILATAAGMRSYAGIATWATTAPTEVLAQLGIRFRRPSEKTFRSLFARLDPGELDRCLGAYFAVLAVEPGGLLAVAMDGKTLRAAKRMGAAASHLVSVFAHGARLVVGQLAVDEKSNEIPCLQKLLRLLPAQIKLLVTIDALHTQVKTAKLICGKLKSHYLMTVKANQPKLLARITALPWTQVPHSVDEESRGHGRVEKRTLQILTSAKGIGFPYARQIIRVTRERLVTATSQRSVEVVYAISSLTFEQARPALIAQWLQQHWGIENRVHWVRDMTFDEDRCTIRTGAAPQVMASLRNAALNLHRINGANNIAEACRLTAFSTDRGLYLLTDHQNSSSQAC